MAGKATTLRLVLSRREMGRVAVEMKEGAISHTFPLVEIEKTLANSRGKRDRNKFERDARSRTVNEE